MPIEDRKRDLELIEATLALRSPAMARALGISPRLLWDLTHNNEIPHIRVGNGKRQTLLYPVAEVQAWLRSRSQHQKAVQP
jgi:hypothetical protein